MQVVLATGIYPPETGGPATFVPTLARELIRRGHEVSVVTYGSSQTPRDNGWSVQVVTRSGGPVLRYLRYAWTLFWCARRADVIFLQGPVSEGSPGTIAALLLRKPTVMRIAGDFAWEAHQRMVGEEEGELLDIFLTKRHRGLIGFFERAERWAAKRAKYIITPSGYLKGVVEQWGIPSAKIHVIYNTVEVPRPTASREVLRQEFGCEDKYVILTNVRAVPWKGVDFLLEVVKDLPSNVVFVVVGGEGPMLPAWKEQAKSLGLKERVRFTGRVSRERVMEWMKAADQFVLASSYEGFPHVVVEAVMMGLPTLVSDKGGNPETARLFPDAVRVLPYRDYAAWKSALAEPAARLREQSPRPFNEVADQVLKVLEVAV